MVNAEENISLPPGKSKICAPTDISKIYLRICNRTFGLHHGQIYDPCEVNVADLYKLSTLAEYPSALAVVTRRSETGF